MKYAFLGLAVPLFLSFSAQAAGRFGHVFVIVEENHSFKDVITNNGMPYLKSLAAANALGTNFYGNAHPSIGNYFMMTTGQIITKNDSYMETVDADNIVREMAAAGKTWKSYTEGIPSTGYTGGNVGAYVRRHNPFSFFSDVVNNDNERQNLVPTQQFQEDLVSESLPDLSFIVPDVDDDAHDGSLASADNWLKENVDPLINSKFFANDGLLLITFDESKIIDLSHGGGHIPFVAVGSGVKKGFVSTTFYQHENLLALTCAALGLEKCPGAAATANDMSEFLEP